MSKEIKCSKNGTFFNGLAMCGKFINSNKTCGDKKGTCEHQTINGIPILTVKKNNYNATN
ncbi:hypothetical protein [Thiomicrorhabdus lithotrophica]|uniref:Uncharacterized protein n=1 Tax=Thiomicrorhabdus lithotrophica TaxID=2949997 RepID=A0ABY8CCB7_9GAMM|nr:hypothetical protein [Thiomicrorhabdus lithotrophica]WEJ62191.1 hypothetical protein NR989_09235 [Thiomicrorhabdus lithotrophica]